MKQSLPEFLRSYFWDVKFEELEERKHAFLITKRILDRGGSQAIRWLGKTYGWEQVKDVVRQTKDLSPVSGNFWATVFHLDRSEVPCLQKPYSRIRFGLSS